MLAQLDPSGQQAAVILAWQRPFAGSDLFGQHLSCPVQQIGSPSFTPQHWPEAQHFPIVSQHPPAAPQQVALSPVPQALSFGQQISPARQMPAFDVQHAPPQQLLTWPQHAPGLPPSPAQHARAVSLAAAGNGAAAAGAGAAPPQQPSEQQVASAGQHTPPPPPQHFVPSVQQLPKQQSPFLQSVMQNPFGVPDVTGNEASLATPLQFEPLERRTYPSSPHFAPQELRTIQ